MLYIAFCLWNQLLFANWEHLFILAMKRGFVCNLQPNLWHDQVSASKRESVLTLFITSLGANIMACGNIQL